MSDKELQWDELEDFVRLITQIKFGAPARAEDIAGVRCDCVAHLDDGSVVLAEVSRQRTLTKLREDLTKLKFGRASAAAGYFSDFKRIRGKTFENLESHSMPHGTYSYRPLNAYLRAITASKTRDRRTIGEVMESAFKGDLIFERDAHRLAQFTAKDIATYLTSHDQPKLTSKLQALTKSGNKLLVRRALAAAKKIAAMHPLNRMRMEGMGLVGARKGPTKHRADTADG